MMLRKRLVVTFMLVIAIMAAFAIYQSVVYKALLRQNENLAQLGRMSETIDLIRTDQSAYLDLNARRYIASISERMLKLKGQTALLLDQKLQKTSQSLLQQMAIEYGAYEGELNAFISTNDQYHALLTQKTENTQDIVQLAKDYPVALMQNPDYLKRLLVATATISALGNSYIEERLSAFTTLESIGFELTLSPDNFDLQLYGQRLKNEAERGRELVVSVETTLIANQGKLYNLNSALQLLSERLEKIKINEERYATRMLNNVQLIYWSAFLFLLTVVSVLLYRLTKRITQSVNTLVMSANGIASGNADISDAIELKGNDEFTILAERLNAMSKSLRMSNLSIKTYSNQLEHMVKAKTYELTKANDQMAVLNLTLNQEKEKYAKLALTDVLTGLNNRAYFMEALHQKIDEARRYGKNFSLLLLDIDHFKQINDRFGHMVGDEALKQFSRLIKQETRASDVVARYGGEEFIAILTEAKLSDAYSISERLRITVAAERFDTVGLSFTISGGLVVYQGESEDELLNKVDELLYEAKAQGRNRIVKQNLTI